MNGAEAILRTLANNGVDAVLARAIAETGPILIEALMG